MPWAAGSFSRLNGDTGWVDDASLGIGIEAGEHDLVDTDFKNGINQCLNKDGSNSCTGDLNLGGFKPVNLAAGTAAAPAICAGGDVNTGIFSPAADQIGIATNGTERVRIDASGKVLVGRTTPVIGETIGSTGYGIVGSTTGDGQFIFGSGGSSTVSGSYDNTPHIFRTNNTERMRITIGGFVFINTTTNFSADKLCLAFGAAENGLGIRDNNDTSGTVFAAFRNSANGLCGSVTRVTTTNAVNYNTSSDYRLKENVAPLQNGLQRTLALKPVKFDWIEGGEAAEGFIAHEVASVFAQAVSGVKDEVYADGQPKYQGVDYGKLTPLLAAAIQELAAKVEALEARVAELEAA